MIFKYANLKTDVKLLLSLYQRLRNSKYASEFELEALKKAIDLMNEKLTIIEEELKKDFLDIK